MYVSDSVVEAGRLAFVTAAARDDASTSGCIRAAIEAALPCFIREQATNSIDEGGDNAKLQSMRSGDDHSPGRELGGESGSRTQRDPLGGIEPVASSGLDDDPTNGDGGEPGLAGGQSGDPRRHLPGTEVSLIDRGKRVAVTDTVRVIDGEGFGLVGEVSMIQTSGFGHVHVTLQTADGQQLRTLEEKVSLLESEESED